MNNQLLNLRRCCAQFGTAMVLRAEAGSLATTALNETARTIYLCLQDFVSSLACHCSIRSCFLLPHEKLTLSLAKGLGPVSPLPTGRASSWPHLDLPSPVHTSTCKHGLTFHELMRGVPRHKSSG